MNVAFVILHYLAEKDTIECIESIRHSVTYKEKTIIVVDNASTNQSFSNIKKLYRDSGIIFISNAENLGFARGNNVGFQYAKNVIKANFIVLLNNDTIIEQNNFVDIILEKYSKYKFYVLGPDIVSNDGFHQNPMKNRNWNKRKLKLFKLKTQLRLLDLHMFSLGPQILKKKQKADALRAPINGDVCNIRLHGACLIFSPDYVQEYDGLDDGTFLYMEEDLLQIHMRNDNRSMWYSSDLHIFHKEDASTNMLGGSPKEKQIRFLQNLINSIDVCISKVD